MKIKFVSVDNLPLNKTLKLHTLTIILRSVFEKTTSIIHTFFRRLFVLGIDDTINIKKSNKSKECMLCHYWYILDIGY